MERYKISSSNSGSTAKAGRASAGAKTSHLHASDRQTARPAWLVPAILGAAVLVLGGGLLSLVLARQHTATNTARRSAPPASSTARSTTTSAKPAGVVGSVPTSVRDGVVAAVELKQLSKLGSFFAARVHIVIAGSSVNTTVSANQAQALLNSLNSATNPWNWNIPQSELTQWQSGPYGQYFEGNVIVGESANGYVVSFTVDSSGQVTGVFIAPSADLLSPSGGTSSGGGTTTPTTPDNPPGVE